MERVGLCISLDVIRLHDAVVHIGYLYWLIVIFNLRLRLENRKKAQLCALAALPVRFCQ